MDKTTNENGQKTTLPELLSRHRESLLRDSGISAEILEEARVFSGDEATAQSFVGYPQPGILFPYHDLRGEMIGARIRFDEPMQNSDGKPIRYLQPKGTTLDCYFIPSSIPEIMDTNKTLVVVEGEKKALAVASHLESDDSVVVAYPGCWNWKEPGEDGGLGPTWKAIPLQGRTVLWMPDTDFFLNPKVAAAGERFIYHLTRARAKVQLIDLRIGDLAVKVGADDFIVQSGGAELNHRCDSPLWSFSADPNDIEQVEPTESSVRKYTKTRVCTPTAEMDLVLYALKKKTKFNIEPLKKIYKQVKREWDVLKGTPRRAEERRIIRVDSDRYRRSVLAEITSVLQDDGRFYRYGKELLRIGKDKEIVTADSLPAKLNDLLIECAIATQQGEEYLLLPSGLAKTLLYSNSLLDELNEIVLFANHPIYDSQWNLARPGYNPEDKIFYLGEPVEPIREPKVLREITRDFLFKNDASHCNYIAALLSALLRNKYVGDKPFFALTGNRPNIGKTLSCKVLSIVAEGRSTETMTYNPNQEELEKQVASRVDKRDVVIIDNIRSSQPIASPVLERMVTDALISFRRLGQTSTITRPNTIILMVTMNSAQFNQDLITRALPIEFYLDESKDATKQKFPHASLEKFVLENRMTILREICGMVEVWKEKGRPPCSKNFRFRTWTGEIGGILEANGFTAFLDNLESATAEYDQLSHEIGRLFEDRVGQALTADELVQSCAHLGLFADILLQSRRAATSLSNLLGRYVDKKIPLPDGSFVILRGGYHPSKKVNTFTATPLDAPSPSATGTPGTHSGPRSDAGEDKASPKAHSSFSAKAQDPDHVPGVPGHDASNSAGRPAGNDLEW